MWISRSWVSRPSTIGPSRATASSSSCAIGSSLLLPLVITSGRPTPRQQEVVERRVREEHPEVGQIPGRPRGAISVPTSAVRRGTSTIGRRGDSSATDRVVVEHRRRRRAASRSGTITANGLSSRALRRRSSCTAIGVGRRRRQGGSRRSLSRATIAPSRSASTAARSASSPLGQGFADGGAPREAWPAFRAGVGLRVEAPVARIVVLGAARRAHREGAHGGGRAVVRDVEDDRVPRTAVGAVRERVAVAAVGGVVDLGQAVVARRGVDAHRHRRRTGRVGLDDAEAVALAARRPRAPRSRRRRGRAVGVPR